MVELSFYVSPEDYTRLKEVAEKMGISEREFLYRALMRYIGLQEKQLSGHRPAPSDS